MRESPMHGLTGTSQPGHPPALRLRKIHGKALDAQRLVEVRDRWMNPPEWEWVHQPVPGYPRRPVPRDEDAANAPKNAS